MDDLDVAVIGGGIGGLTVAIALRRSGHRVAVYEQTRRLRAAGAGISVWSNGVKALNLLGLGRAIEQCSGHLERMAYASFNGTTLCDFSLDRMVSEVGQRPCPVSRSALQEMLTGALDPGQINLGMRCVEVGEADGARTVVRFEDGSELTADVVVAADGTHSVLRNYVTGKTVERRYVGYVNWNGLVDWSDDLSARSTWITWVGQGKRVSLMPVGGGQSYFFFDVPIPDLPGSGVGPASIRDDLAAHFEGWAAPVQRLVDRLDPASVNRVAIHDHEPLEGMSRGSVVLIGDAAHTMAPDLGQGGCQAMEDAVVLTRCLTANNLGVSDALARFDRSRRSHTTDIVRRARKRAGITHGTDGSGGAATEAWYRELDGTDGAAIIAGLIQSVVTGPLG